MSPVQLVQQLNQAASPLSQEQVTQLQQFVGQLNPIQQAWVSGYLAASANVSEAALDTSIQTSEASVLTILYGSQTGNAKGVAVQLQQQAESQGLATKLINMADYKPNQLKKEKYIAVVVSTYGEGEPPEDAENLHSFLSSKKAPKLDGLKVAVIGLGDSSYEFFCQTAIDFDERFTALGATSFVARAELDVDYEDSANEWIANAVQVIKPELEQQAVNTAQVIPINPLSSVGSNYSKQQPYEAEISVVQKITGKDSTKDIRHIEISLDDSGIQYQVGDALGVYFQNDKARVERLLTQLNIDPTELVTIGEEQWPVQQALIEKLELTQSYPGFVEKYAELSGNQFLIDLCQDKAQLRLYIEPRQIFDIVNEHPAAVSAQGLVEATRKMQPRLYSIASSQQEVEDEVHLTVAVVEYEAFGEQHFGGCSGYLSQLATEGEKVKVYVESNDHFRLPSDDSAPVIMIGPGTGIAPFRGFLQEREARGAIGDNWLFFGNPHFTQDFLYQVEIQKYVKSGLLTKVDLAFSRDQQQKIYVQHRLLEQGKDIYEWLQKGAYLYVCGDAKHMAKDVHQALVDIVQTHGGLNKESAENYLKALKDNHKYQKDVY